MLKPESPSKAAYLRACARALQQALDQLVLDAAGREHVPIRQAVVRAIRLCVDEGQLTKSLPADDPLLLLVKEDEELKPGFSYIPRRDKLLAAVACFNPEMRTMEEACQRWRSSGRNIAETVTAKLRSIRRSRRTGFLKASQLAPGQSLALKGRQFAAYPMDPTGRYFSEYEHDKFVQQRADHPFHLAHAFAWARMQYARILEEANELVCPWTGLTPDQLRGPDPTGRRLYIYLARDMLEASYTYVPTRNEHGEPVNVTRGSFARYLQDRAEREGVAWASVHQTGRRAEPMLFDDPAPAPSTKPAFVQPNYEDGAAMIRAMVAESLTERRWAPAKPEPEPAEPEPAPTPTAPEPSGVEPVPPLPGTGPFRAAEDLLDRLRRQAEAKNPKD